MKIGKLVVKNVTSYKHKTEFDFDRGMNIIIGPNGGGKSNLQLIIAVLLTKFFIHQYQVKRSDEETKFEIADHWNKRTLERNLDRFTGDASDQEIDIELIPESFDVENIRSIGGNLERFNEQFSFYETKYETYGPLALAEKIATAKSFFYKIRNLELVPPEKGSAEVAFLEYLQTFFIFKRVANRVEGVSLSSPVFFSSERALTKNFDIPAGHLTEDHYQNGFRTAYSAATGQSTNLLQWGAQHFVRLYRRAQKIAGDTRGAVVKDFLEKEPDVRLLRRYLAQLGYDWAFRSDDEQTTFAFVLIKDDATIGADMFSSGEREIVHFLLAMFALNVRDGLVLVDEPELHLHPRWQRIFLGLFRDLAPERNNQFIISTHSPVFVTPDTVHNITRIYKRPKEGSCKIALSDIHLPEQRKLVRMINSHNNERLFFADKVVLVEGISDRLVLESLLDGASVIFGKNTAIEVVEVGGKHNFIGYQELLDALRTPWIVVADRDYLTSVGSRAVKSLFEVDAGKQWNVLTEDRKSADRRTMMSELERAIELGDTNNLLEFAEYFRSRHQRLKEPLSAAEIALLERELEDLRSYGINILRHGEIEAYLPDGVRDVSAIVDKLMERNWINDLRDTERRMELGKLICRILEVSDSNVRARIL